ncbi:MAG: tetraacyldisaccharide 4'-kinase [Candidatus Omnitrophota bacterium]
MKEYLYGLVTERRKGSLAALLKFFLLIASFIYGGLIRGLIAFYRLRPARLRCKVISVGNITLGGTGKTSLVELISGFLRGQGRKVAVLSRGYKRIETTMGDEPAMLLKKLGDVPVIVGSDRVKSAKRAVEEYGVDTVIIDDGLQQWRIKKDLEIVTVSVPEGFGNRHMLPRGLLRQPLSTLKEADIFFLTKTDLGRGPEEVKAALAQINPGAPVVESRHETAGFYEIAEPALALPPDFLQGKNVVLFSGIGDPASFAALAVKAGARIALELKFDDHHHYSDEELAVISAECASRGADLILTTEKDCARLSEAQLNIFKGSKLLALRIGLKIITHEKQFFDRLLGLYPL